MKRENGAILALTLGLAVLVSGCGQTAYNEMGSLSGNVQGGIAANSGTNLNNNSNINNSTVSTPTNPSITPVSTSTEPSADWTFDAKLIGPNSVFKSPTSYPTDSRFLVTVRLQSPDVIIDPKTQKSTGWTPAYRCGKVSITVLGEPVEVSVRLPGYTPTSSADPCMGMPEVAVVDFSKRLGRGHSNLSVTLTNPKSDNCQGKGSDTNMYDGFNWVQQAGCVIDNIYSTHNLKVKV